MDLESFSRLLQDPLAAVGDGDVVAHPGLDGLAQVAVQLHGELLSGQAVVHARARVRKRLAVEAITIVLARNTVGLMKSNMYCTTATILRTWYWKL